MGLLREPLRYLYRRLGPRYPRVLLALQYQITYVVVLGGIGLLALYQPMSDRHLLTIAAVALALQTLDVIDAIRVSWRLLRPAEPWLRGARDEQAAAVAAWRTLASFPLDVTRRRGLPVAALNLLPISIFIVAELGLRWYTVLPVLAGASIVLSYGLLVRYFATELTLRPVLEDISDSLPPGIEPGGKMITLRWKLLAALPAINVITGVVASGLSTRGHAHLSDLGLDVLVALAVAFTVSLELTLLLARSILEPIDDLRRATRRVARGDFHTRVPLISNDETGSLAGSFNAMVAGLQEREKLREAFGTYVDPELAERVLSEGTVLEGEEVEVSVLFLDIRDFTSFAERASAREVVGLLNEFYECVVPVIMRHGGHANKFIGDGLLAVFGAPDRLPDHADRAAAAAIDIAATVRREYQGRVRIGIGVNSGPVVAGTVGGGGRLEFTVIGDTVNTAARVEEVTRQTGDDVLITENTRRMLTRDFGVLEERPTVELKGKRERVKLWAPLIAEGVEEQGEPQVASAPGASASLESAHDH